MVSPTLFNRAGLAVIALVAAVGAIDALIGRVWDLTVVFVIIVGWCLALMLRISFRRRPISVRGDLARWLDREAALGGEPVEAIADRAISAYRDGLTAGAEGMRDRAADLR